jgi:hypothetical protein
VRTVLSQCDEALASLVGEAGLKAHRFGLGAQHGVGVTEADAPIGIERAKLGLLGIGAPAYL